MARVVAAWPGGCRNRRHSEAARYSPDVDRWAGRGRPGRGCSCSCSFKKGRFWPERLRGGGGGAVEAVEAVGMVGMVGLGPSAAAGQDMERWMGGLGRLGRLRLMARN